MEKAQTRRMLEELMQWGGPNYPQLPRKVILSQLESLLTASEFQQIKESDNYTDFSGWKNFICVCEELQHKY